MIIAGAGININSEDFPGEINTNPVSLKLLTGKEHDIEELLHQALSEIVDLFEQIGEEIPPALLDEWLVFSNSTGKKIRHTFNSGETEELTITNLSSTGELIAQDAANKLHRITDGEIEYLP